MIVRSGDEMLLLSLNDVSMSFAERTLFSGVSLDVYDNDRIGFVGINGSGKTTLFRMLRGEHIPDEGAIHIAGSCKIGVMEQFACKDSDKTLYDEALTVFEWLEDMELELEELHRTADAAYRTLRARRRTYLQEPHTVCSDGSGILRGRPEIAGFRIKRRSEIKIAANKAAAF